MSNSKTRAIVSSWQLVLLGATGIILSVASGWTTWNGMSNFTREPLLSLMITFGIQGVMLIAAWLIGDTFVTEKIKIQKTPGNGATGFWLISDRRTGALLFLGLGPALLLIASILWGYQNDLRQIWSAQSDQFKHAMLATGGLMFLLIVVGRKIIVNYLQSIRVVAQHAVLWMMFLACMSTSVFFSFDSLFSTIFSEDERLRAAELRTRSEVSGILNNVVDATARRQLERRTALLNSSEWSAYSRLLHSLEKEIQAAPDLITQFLSQRANEAQAVASNRQANLSSIQSQIAQFSRRQQQLSRNHEQLKGQAERLDTTVKTLKQQIFEKDRAIIAKSAEAEAEARGIGVTSKPGRGPKYLELISQVQRFGEEKANLELQLKAYEGRMAISLQAIARAGSELAKLKTGRVQLEAKASAAAKKAGPDKKMVEAGLLRSNLQTALQDLLANHLSFEQNPTRAGLDQLQAQCSKILDLLSSSGLLTSQVKVSSCEPGKTHEVAARLYALNEGAAAASINCRVTKDVSSSTGAQAQLALARTCLQSSRLLPADASLIRAEIDALERRRDDLAHRFIVTMNAFSDGNTLAYLALAIAIAIDALVFMSGLFGANAAGAMGSGTPKDTPPSDRQLEVMLQSALLPDIFGNATSLLAEVSPVVKTRGLHLSPEWTHEIDLGDSRIAAQSSLRMPLNAGVAAGIVQSDRRRPERYFLKAEFIRLLCHAKRHAFSGEQKSDGSSDLISDAHVVMQYLRPTSERDGYSFRLTISEVKAEHVDVTRRCFETLAPLNCVYSVKHEGETARYLINEDLHWVLTFLSSEHGSVSYEPQRDENVLPINRAASLDQNQPALLIKHKDQGSKSETRIPPPGGSPGKTYRDAYRRFKSAQQK